MLTVVYALACRLFELVVLLVAHVVELLGDVRSIGLREAAHPQQGGLLSRPAIEVLVIARRLPSRAATSLSGMDSIVHHAGQ